MTRPLTITAADPPVVPGTRVWIVREGLVCLLHQQFPLVEDPDCGCSFHPPAEFVQACAPCETCGNSRWVDDFDVEPAHGGDSPMRPCTDCRIELLGPCPMCGGNGMIAHCGRTDNGSDGPCVLAPHPANFPCYGEGDVASDWSPVSWCRCGLCSCGSHQAWTEEDPCGYCHEQPAPGTVTFGHAYAAGQPLPIVAAVALHGANLAALSWPNVQVSQRGDALTLASGNDWSPSSDLTDHLAHYGPPESLVGKWALRLAVARG